MPKRHDSGMSKFSCASSSARVRISSGVPSMATRPARNTATRSASAASSIKCVIITIVMPRSCNARQAFMRPLRPRGSSIEDASSKMSTRGSMASTPASATRCFWPPESAWVSWRSKPTRPTAFSTSRTRCAICSDGTPNFRDQRQRRPRQASPPVDHPDSGIPCPQSSECRRPARGRKHPYR